MNSASFHKINMPGRPLMTLSQKSCRAGDPARSWSVAARNQRAYRSGCPICRRFCMRVAASLAVFILISIVSCVAQTAPTAQNQHPFRPDPATFRTPMDPACPIDMQVRQGIGGAMVAVDENGVKRSVFAPKYRLVLNEIRKPGQKI